MEYILDIGPKKEKEIGLSKYRLYSIKNKNK